MKKREYIDGAKASIPIILGYLPIGMAYGILARQAGLSTAITVLMSIFVFAGSSQLICVNMVSAGVSIIPIILMTFLVNLRHLLMSASLSIYLKKASGWVLPFVGFLITDESFAVGTARIEEQEDKAGFFLGLGLTAYLSWVISSWVGAILNDVLALVDLPGLDFVLPAMFIVLLVMQLQRKLDILVAVISGLFSLIFVFILPANWNVITATIIAATIGVVIERWK